MQYREFLKRQSSIDKLKELYPTYKKDFKLILQIAVEEVTGFEVRGEKNDHLVEYLGTPDYHKQLDKFESLQQVREIDLRTRWQSSALLEGTTGIENIEDYCDLYTGIFYRLNKQLWKVRLAYAKNAEYFDRFD